MEASPQPSRVFGALTAAVLTLVSGTPVLAQDSVEALLDRAAVAASLPGFGGAFVDHEGTLNIYLLEPEEVGNSVPGARILEGRYTFDLLQAYRARLSSVLNLPGVVFLDVDETANRILIGHERSVTPALAGSLGEILRLQDVPPEALLTREVEPISPLATVRDELRPVPGGAQIEFSGFLCTLGFNAVTDFGSGFVTSSHCTDVQGGEEGTVFRQPVPAAGILGTEASDPPYVTAPGCPPGRRCRVSDSALVLYDTPSLSAGDAVARTTFAGTSSGSLVIDSANPSFIVIGTQETPVSGQTLDKIGRTTGWTTGSVTQTCVDINVAGTDITLLCQDLFSAGSASGDSGAPVFFRSGNGAILAGILWGGSSSLSAFSAMANIDFDLKLQSPCPTGGACTAGQTCCRCIAAGCFQKTCTGGAWSAATRCPGTQTCVGGEIGGKCG